MPNYIYNICIASVIVTLHVLHYTSKAKVVLAYLQKGRMNTKLQKLSAKQILRQHLWTHFSIVFYTSSNKYAAKLDCILFKITFFNVM